MSMNRNINKDIDFTNHHTNWEHLNIYSTINMSSKVKGISSGKLEHHILIYLNDELSTWLGVKAAWGYIKILKCCY